MHVIPLGMHPRNDIRDAVRWIVDHAPDIDATVNPWITAENIVHVSTPLEEVLEEESYSSMGGKTTRRLTIDLEVRWRADDLPTDLDSAVRAVVEAMAADPTLEHYGEPRGVELTLEEARTIYDDELEKHSGNAYLRYSFLYAVDPAVMNIYLEPGS